MMGLLIKNNKKIILIIILLTLALGTYTVLNAVIFKNQNTQSEDIYANQISRLVADSQFDNIDYYLMRKDLDDMNSIIKEQISLNLENNVEEESYIVANNIYTEKITEFTEIFANKVDDETYKLFLDDLDSFNKDLNFNLDSMKNDILSESEYRKYFNEYSYIEKQKFLSEMLEKYRYNFE